MSSLVDYSALREISLEVLYSCVLAMLADIMRQRTATSCSRRSTGSGGDYESGKL